MCSANFSYIDVSMDIYGKINICSDHHPMSIDSTLSHVFLMGDFLFLFC